MTLFAIGVAVGLPGMEDALDVAQALEEVAERLRTEGFVGGPLLAYNGVQVGEWEASEG